MLPVCTLIQDEILCEFRVQNFLPLNFLEFVGDGIGTSVYPGNNFFENSGCSKFGRTENSWEMLDQYY